MARRRLDSELVARGLVKNVDEARRLIDDNRVLISGAPVSNPSSLVSRGDEVGLLPSKKFVSRGGEKLDIALDNFQIDVTGLHCLDAGAGSGGFTDALLKRGAAYVVAVDVGYGQFDWKLRNDPRVHLLERTNIRIADLDTLSTEGKFDLIVADLAFISLKAVAVPLSRVCKMTGSLVLLVKPQFEAEPNEAAGGVVVDPAVWKRVTREVADEFSKLGCRVCGAVASHLVGPEGNREFFLWLSRNADKGIIDPIDKAVEEVP